MSYLNSKKYTIFVFLLFFFNISCAQDKWKPMMIEKQPLKFLALGDSYTIGEAVSSKERWPQYLVDMLNKDSFQIIDPQIIARTGWTTDELKQAINEQNPEANYDLVSLLIGVNNQYRGYDINLYEKEFEELLLAAIRFAEGDPKRVFVVSIPDYGVTPFAENKNPSKIAKELNEYNAISERIATNYQVKWFDITPISRMASSDPELTATDKLHPSGKMYAQWVHSFYDEVKLLLKK
jgi:acyl-CoA thioesterase I